MKIFGMEADYGISWIAIIILFIPLIQRLIMDIHQIKIEQKEINHKLHTFYTGVIMLMGSLIIADLDHGQDGISIIILWFKAVCLSFSIFFLLFDYVLNICLRKKWYYIDTGKGDSIHSISDGLYAKLGVIGTAFIKICTFLIGISIYFLSSYIVG